MIGLMLIGFFAIYLLLSVFVAKKAAGWAKANNRRPWVCGGLAAFVMYNLVFWDWIPTVLAHKYYCSTQAGFFVYKTPEQWKIDNPDLTAEEVKSLGEEDYIGSGKYAWRFPYLPLPNNPEQRADMVNKRVYLGGELERNISKYLPIHKTTSFIADTKNNQILAQKTTFSSGYRDPMGVGGLQGFKYWLVNKSCSVKSADSNAKYLKYIDEVVSLGVKNDNN